MKEGGAVYDFISDLQVGIANLADSLAAIKKVVFEDRKVTPAELWEALQADFAGEKHERIRRFLQEAPKYGNDDDYVDQLVVDAYNVYIDEMKKYHNTRYGRGPIGGVYYAAPRQFPPMCPRARERWPRRTGERPGRPWQRAARPATGRM